MTNQVGTKRLYMISYFNRDKNEMDFIKLPSSSYEDAMMTARCVCGDGAAQGLCYRDFVLYD